METHRILKKKFWNGESWELKEFFVVDNHDKTSVEWLRLHYGNPSYGNTWWVTITSIVMSSKVYMHFSLVNN